MVSASFLSSSISDVNLCSFTSMGKVVDAISFRAIGRARRLSAVSAFGTFRSGMVIGKEAMGCVCKDLAVDE